MLAWPLLPQPDSFPQFAVGLDRLYLVMPLKSVSLGLERVSQS